MGCADLDFLAHVCSHADADTLTHADTEVRTHAETDWVSAHA